MCPARTVFKKKSEIILLYWSLTDSHTYSTRGPNKRLILHLSPGFMAVCLCCQMPLSAVFNLAITNSIFKQPSRYFFGHSSIFILSLTGVFQKRIQNEDFITTRKKWEPTGLIISPSSSADEATQVSHSFCQGQSSSWKTAGLDKFHSGVLFHRVSIWT